MPYVSKDDLRQILTDLPAAHLNGRSGQAAPAPTAARVANACVDLEHLRDYVNKEDIVKIAVKNHFDYICVPNVTSVKDVQEIRYARTDAGSRIGIIAKIDNLEAVHQFDGILKYADGVVVLRNELGIELAPEKLMLAQKWMIQTANMAAVPIFLQS